MSNSHPTPTVAAAVSATTVRAMALRLVFIYLSATDDQRREGRNWYDDYRSDAQTLADRYGYTVTESAAVIALTSPQQTPSANLRTAEAILKAHSTGQDPRNIRGISGYPAMIRAAADVLDGDYNATEFKKDAQGRDTGSMKTRVFWRNIIGETERVTVDVWAQRAALSRNVRGQASGASYRKIESAYIEAARMLGESPRDLQAIVWVVERGSAW